MTSGSGGDRRTPQRVVLDIDYSYKSVLFSKLPVEHLLTDGLRLDLAVWQDEFERANPSDPDALGAGWIKQARSLRSRVQAELGPDYEVVCESDERRARRGLRPPR